MKTNNTNLRSLTTAIALLGSLAVGAEAAITVTILEDGTGLTMQATGSYDLSTITPVGGANLGRVAAIIPAGMGDVYGWETGTSSQRFNVTTTSGNITGTGVAVFPTNSTTTNPFYLLSSAVVLQNGAPSVGTVNETAFFAGVTLASLGMTAGDTMTLTWSGDSATITTGIVPEPSSSALLGLGCLTLAFRRSRR